MDKKELDIVADYIGVLKKRKGEERQALYFRAQNVKSLTCQLIYLHVRVLVNSILWIASHFFTKKMQEMRIIKLCKVHFVIWDVKYVNIVKNVKWLMC